MKTKAPVSYFFILLCFILASCGKDTVTPTSGGLKISMTYPVAFSGVNVELYTEALYIAGLNVSPLYEGTLPNVPANTEKGTSVISLTSLIAGDYVLVVGSNSYSIQVVAGSTIDIKKDF